MFFLFVVTFVVANGRTNGKGSIGLPRAPLERINESIHYKHTLLISNCFVAFFHVKSAACLTNDFICDTYDCILVSLFLPTDADVRLPEINTSRAG